MRKGLLAHRSRRKEQKTNAVSTKITEIFARLHDTLSTKWRSKADDERFETTLITYDDDSHRLLVVEGRNNGGEILHHPWDFYLPFGLGLARACFRAGTGAFTYSGARDDRDPLKPEPYLPHPGSEPHAFLIAFPIDHPDLYESEAPDQAANGRAVQRCRQLVGVLTIATNFGASPLLEYCRRRPAAEAERAKLKKTLGEVRNECQSHCDQVSAILLGRSN